MAYDELHSDQLAAVVTYLEMLAPPADPVPPSPLRLSRIEPDVSEYRRLFRKVGERWLWFSRLVMPDEQLTAIIGDPKVHLYRVEDRTGAEAGLLELDFRESAACELAFVGLVSELAGQGYGRWLLAEAVRLAWAPGVERVHVHTCSLDHPAALAAYRRAGFTPFRRAVERFADPRVLGILPPTAAPQIPLLGTDVSASPAPANWT